MATIDDIYSVLQNAVQAINGLTQAYLNNEGQASLEGLTATALIKKGRGRIARVAVTTAGTTVGSVYDAASTSLATTATLLVTIPNTVGIVDVSMPYESGLVITPGSGQVLSVSYS